jgi:hypothetical protein
LRISKPPLTTQRIDPAEVEKGLHERPADMRRKHIGAAGKRQPAWLRQQFERIVQLHGRTWRLK